MKNAFTLIELLVVIAIIAILAAILFPVFAKAREMARGITCVSNERQMAMAIRMYTQDYDENYPNTNDPYLWVGKRFRWPIMTYLGAGQKEGLKFSSLGGSPSILICPSDPSATTFDATSYGYSATFYHSPDQINQMHINNLRLSLNDPGAGAICLSQTEAALLTPSQKILISEFTNNHRFDNKRVGYWGTLQGPAAPGPDRWQGARNQAMADGHVKLIFAAKVHPSTDDCPDFNLTINGISGSDID